MLTNRFHVIEAIEGTWLSAACRKFGWGAEYGPEDGYGAYVEGIVRREDGSYIWDAAADKIKPGELFAIEIYKGKSEKKPKRKEEGGKLSPDQEDRIQTKPPTIEIATAIGLGAEVVGQIFEGFGVFWGFLMIPFQMADLGKDPHLPMAAARAQCYARTAFVWREHERTPLPISKAFHHISKQPVQIDRDLWEKMKKAWNDSWVEHTRDLRTKFDSARVKIYMEVSRKHGNVNAVSEIALRNYIKRMAEDKYGTSAQFCDMCLVEVTNSNWWRDNFPPTVKPLWETYRQTKYPN